MSASGSDGVGVFGVLIAGTVTLVSLTILLLLTVTILGGMIGAFGGVGVDENRTANPDPVTGSAVQFADSDVTVTAVYQVNDSTGYGIELQGTPDSEVTTDETFGAYNDSFTIGTWARVNGSSGSEDMHLVSVGEEVHLQYNGSDSQWTVWYYNVSDGNSTRVNVSAPNQPGNWTWVEAWRNDTHLTIYANTTQGETVAIDPVAGTQPAQLNRSHFNGTIDETRTFDDAWNDSERSAHVADPILPRPDNNRTSRITYDEGSGSTTEVYFTGSDATLSDAAWVRALPGQELSAGSDYTLSSDNRSITAVAGGRIDGAPVVWVTYRVDSDTRISPLVEPIATALDLMSSSVIVIPLVAILAVLVGGLVASLSGLTGRGGGGPGGRFGR